MIPKKIHFFWAGSQDYPELVRECIDSWKTIMPDYEIVKWDESSDVIQGNRFAREALQCKKYAFVADFIRLYAMYEHGGIYLDTDVKVFKRFDDLLGNHGFTGFESKRNVGVWLLASERHNPIFKEMLDCYADKVFFSPTGEMDMTPNPVVLRPIFQKYGIKINGEYQESEYITVYPVDYFCPMDPSNGSVNITDNTYAMHLFDGSWLSDKEKKRLALGKVYFYKLHVLLPYELADGVAKIIAALKVGGLTYLLKKVLAFIAR